MSCGYVSAVKSATIAERLARPMKCDCDLHRVDLDWVVYDTSKERIRAVCNHPTAPMGTEGAIKCPWCAEFHMPLPSVDAYTASVTDFVSDIDDADVGSKLRGYLINYYVSGDFADDLGAWACICRRFDDSDPRYTVVILRDGTFQSAELAEARAWQMLAAWENVTVECARKRRAELAK